MWYPSGFRKETIRFLMPSLRTSRFNVFIDNYQLGKTLVFNTLSKSLTLLDPEVAAQLQTTTSHQEGQLPSLTEHERESLLQTGVLISNQIDEIAKLRFQRTHAKFGSGYALIIILFTVRCNFACTYCYQDTLPTAEDLSLSDWKIINRFIEEQVTSKRVRKLEVVLFGGEPLLNDTVLLKAAVDLRMLEKLGIGVNLSLNTNGSLLDKKLVEQLSPLIDSVAITIDGPKARHDKLRPFADGGDSYERVYDAFRLCLESAIPHVKLRTNFQPNEIDMVRQFLTDFANSLPNIGEVEVSFSEIAPTLSELHSGCYTPDTAGRSLAMGLYREAQTLGYRFPGFGFSPGVCSAETPDSMVIDPNLIVYKCLSQLPDQGCARITPDAKLEPTSSDWYEIPNRHPECVYNCKYGPICHGGCPVLPSHDIGGEFCPSRIMLDEQIPHLIATRVKTLAAGAS